MERDSKASWWPQALLERCYLTASDRFEISTPSVGEEEERQPQRIDSLGSGAAWTLAPPLTSQSSTFLWACMDLLLRMGKNPQRSGLDLHSFSVVVVIAHRNKSTEVCRGSWKIWDKVFLFHSLTKRPALIFLQCILYWQVHLPLLYKWLSCLHVPLFPPFPTAVSV